MKGRIFIIFCLFSTTVTNAEPSPRVVGGTDAPPGKYPFQIITRFNNSFLCGGTILNRRYVLTAAHCLSGFDIALYEVVTGINRQSENGTVYPAEKLIIHRRYNPKEHLNDIGLIRVKQDILYSKTVKPVPLPGRYFHYYRDITLIGFGRLGIDSPAAETLQEIKLEMCPYLKCRSIIPYVRRTHVCTLTKAGEGACNGDSGGALLAKGRQIGIVSFGVPCAIGAPDVYTRVQSYLPWIKNNSKTAGPLLIM